MFLTNDVVFVFDCRMEAEEWFIVRQEEAESLRKKEVIGKIMHYSVLGKIIHYSVLGKILH